MTKPSIFEIDVLLGAMSGMRTSSPQVAVAEKPDKFWLAFAGECVVDKLPQTPDRTAPGGTIGRLVSSAAAAGRLASRDDRPIVIAAVTAGISALICTRLGYELRRRICAFAHIPDPLYALVEDALAVALILRVRDARA